ncbi:Small G protein signaling modulator 2 [Armadillidium vulgare]|nr:Small G protein signaling modulator 2 [Armadillidium vulgare]
MDLMSPLLKGSSWFPRVPKLSSHSSSTSSSKSLSLGDSLSDAVAPPPTPIPTPTPAPSLDVIISGDTLTVANGGQVPSTDSADQEKNSDSLEILCSTMKHQIISRAFYGWLAHCRHLRTVRTHLAGLVLPSSALPLSQNTEGWKEGLTEAIWRSLTQDGRITDKDEIRGRVYFGGIEHTIRKEMWPYLLEHFEFGSTEEEREELDLKVFEPDDDASLSSNDNPPVVQDDDDVEEEVVVEEDLKGNEKEEKEDLKNCESEERPCQDQLSSSATTEKLLSKESSYEDAKSPTCVVTPDEGVSEGPDSETICSPEYEDAMSAVDDDAAADTEVKELTEEICARLQEEEEREKRTPMNSRMASEDPSEKDNLTITEGSEPKGLEAKSPCISPASSHGGIYSTDLLESFGLNLHRIDKDVQRCDRHYWYFQKCNLEKLRNVMCTYVWEHLDTGYMQGMCDLAAPLLVIFDDEAMTYACFCHLMNRMSANFPNGGAMDQHFANMRSLIQILDSEMFELMHQNGDYTHFYFCYRWFLLDFKRELVYEDVFTVWEVIWAARYVSSGHFVLFIALALVQYYRAIILENSMDFTDIIKFFNEMAGKTRSKSSVENSAKSCHPAPDPYRKQIKKNKTKKKKNFFIFMNYF